MHCIKKFIVALAIGASSLANALDVSRSIHDAGGQRISRLEQASKKQPDAVQVWLELAEAQLFHGQPLLARCSLNRALALDNASLPALVLLGQLERRMYRFPEAMQALQRAQTIDANAPGVIKLNAGLLLDKMDYPAATALYQTVLKNHPDDAWALAGMAEVAYWEEHFDLAETYLTASIASDPSQSRPWLLRSWIQRAQ